MHIVPEKGQRLTLPVLHAARLRPGDGDQGRRVVPLIEVRTRGLFPQRSSTCPRGAPALVARPAASAVCCLLGASAALPRGGVAETHWAATFVLVGVG